MSFKIEINIFIISIFYLLSIIQSGPICNIFENHCHKCNPITNLCLKCELDVYAPDNNGGCVGAEKCTVGKNYCNECDNSGKQCAICERGYYPDKNGGCSYTENCIISNKGDCLECEEDFILIGNYSEFKLCKYLYTDDFKHCKEINTDNGKCLECEDGYFLNLGDKKCNEIEKCYESIYGNCLSCNYGYYLNKKDKKCNVKAKNFLHCKQTLDGETCDECDDRKFFDENGICVENIYCSKSLNATCIECIPNYYLTVNYACSNDKNCWIADQETGICSLCDRDYYLDVDDYKCKSNQEDNDFKFCQKVENNKCTECIKNNNLSKDSKCTSSNRCLAAENGKCIECEENYFLGLDNNCTSIEHCIYSKQLDECLECEDGYYYHTINRTCLEINDDNLINCKIADDYSCLECKNDFYLNTNDSTCIDNTKEGTFYKCAKTYENEALCQECIEGYFIGTEDRKCTLVNNCKKSNEENICLECDDYFCFDVKNNICIENDYIEDENKLFYFACIITNKDGDRCEKCIEGYEVGENGYCIDNSRCLEKKDGECLKCTEEKNDYDYSYCANKIFGCVETNEEKCVRCDDLLDLFACTECEEGYDLYLGGCIE